jgi:hypothetical protein
MARFLSVDSDLIALSQELERMGGGSAATIAGSFYVRCRAAENGPSIIALQGDSVLLSNPQNPDQRGNKTFSCDGSFSAASTQAEVSESISSTIVNQMKKGFNSLVLSIGETGSGKSHTLFGNASSGSGSKGEGVVQSVVDSFLKAAAAGDDLTIDMAACEIGADASTDLFGNAPLDISHVASVLAIAVTSTQECRLLVRQALQKSRNACVNPSGQLLELAPNRSHLCLRVRIKACGKLSQVWIIDTVGSRPLAGARNSVRHFTSSPDVDREQRVLSQQLFGLNKLLTEMSSVSHAPRTLESARSSNISFFVSNLITDNHSLICLGTVQSDASHHLDTYNTLRISSAARSIIVPCKHTVSPDKLSAVPASQFLLHNSAAKPYDSQKAPSRSPHPLPSTKTASARAAVTPAPPFRANSFGLSTSPTHVIELGSQSQEAHFRASSEADAFELSEDGSSIVLSPLSGDAEEMSASHARARQHAVSKQNQPSAIQLRAFTEDAHAGESQHAHANVHDGYSDASEDHDDGVFFASKIIDDQAAAGSTQVGGWSTFLEENMSSSAASEADNGSVGDTAGEFGHDSSSLKVAFQDTLSKVSSSAVKSDGEVSASSVAHTSPQKETRRSTRPAEMSNAGDRFNQQQPLVHASASRLSYPPSIPAASAISLIPVTASSPVTESSKSISTDVGLESAQVKQVADTVCSWPSFL